MRGRRRRVDEIPAEQSAVVGANIRALRLRNGRTGTLAGGPGCYTSTPKSSRSPSSSWLLSPSQPGRAADRRGGFLVPGPDLTQRHSDSPAAVTEGSRPAVHPGRQVVLGRAVSGLDEPHQDPGSAWRLLVSSGSAGRGNECLDHGCESGIGG